MLCQARDELITAAISLTEMDHLPLCHQRLFCLRQARIVVLQEITACNDAISPIHWIPNEILGEIFSNCLPSNHRFSFAVTPLLLLQVCQLWHDVAVSRGSLWSHMSFWTPERSKTDRMCYPLHFIQPWLLRSGAGVLELSFEKKLVYHHLKPLVELGLVVFSHQCRHLNIHATPQSVLALLEFMILPPGTLINLESLVLEGIEETSFAFVREFLPIITVFRNSPRLRKLTTNLLNFVFTFGGETPESSGELLQLDLFVLPWAQLTHLMVTAFTRVDILVIVLRECTAIQFLRVSLHLGLNIVDLGVKQWLPTEPVLLSELTDFHISLVDGEAIPSLMDSFTYPMLQHLRLRRCESQHYGVIELDLPQSESYFWTDSLHFRQQLGHLRCLSLVGEVGTVEEILILLGNAPRVVDLTLDIWTDYQLLIPALFPPSDIHFPEAEPLPRPLPQLSHIKLYLDEDDFPFPSHFIRNAADSVHFMCFTHLDVLSNLSCLEELQDICCQFYGSRLETTFIGLAGEATRLDTDVKLIDHEHTSREYAML